jgi:hypothetical protein
MTHPPTRPSSPSHTPELMRRSASMSSRMGRHSEIFIFFVCVLLPIILSIFRRKSPSWIPPFPSYTHTDTHTDKKYRHRHRHTYIRLCISLYVCTCVCVCNTSLPCRPADQRIVYIYLLLSLLNTFVIKMDPSIGIDRCIGCTQRSSAWLIMRKTEQ